MLWRQVWWRNFLHFKRTWLGQFFWMISEPMFLLVAVGFGVGTLVPSIQNQTYSEFFFVSVLCFSPILVSFIETSQNGFQKWHQQRLYKQMLFSKMKPSDLVAGEVLWSASKGLMLALILQVVGSLLGLYSMSHFVLDLIFIFLTCVGFASFGFLLILFFRSWESLNYVFSGVIVPLVLLSGTYYPIDSTTPSLGWMFYASPITQLVSVVRSLQAQAYGYASFGNSLVLMIFGVAMFFLTLRRFNKEPVSR